MTASTYLNTIVLYGGLPVTRGTMIQDLRAKGCGGAAEGAYLDHAPAVECAPADAWTLDDLRTLEA